MVSLKTYLQVTGAIFSLVTLLHLLRLVLQWQVVFGNWAVPMWFSFVGLVVGGFLAYTAFSLAAKKKK